MSIDLDPTVAAALDAVARLDGTDPSALAGLIVADWLTEQHARYAAVADAISALAGGNGHEPATPAVEPDQPAPQVKPKPAPAGGPYPCPEDGCARTFASPQGVGGHRAKAHPKAPGRLRPATPAPTEKRGGAGLYDVGQPVVPIDTVRCAVCRTRTPNPRQISGLGQVCPRCAKEAR